jgi:hypothetical protein
LKRPTRKSGWSWMSRNALTSYGPPSCNPRHWHGARRAHIRRVENDEIRQGPERTIFRCTRTAHGGRLAAVAVMDKRKVVTIRPLHRFFALCVSPFFSGPGAKVARSHNVGGKPQWDGVEHIQDLSIVCGSVSIAFGMNETHMDESKDCPRNGRPAPVSDHERLLLLHVDAPAGRAGSSPFSANRAAVAASSAVTVLCPEGRTRK